MSKGTAIVDAFVDSTAEDAPKLSKAASRLGDDALPSLAQLLERFDYQGARGLEMLLRGLDHLDVNQSRKLEHSELVLAIEILELFCKADSVNDTLSVKELEMLLAELEHLDEDQNGLLDPGERSKLREELWDPNAFLESQEQHNPKLRELLG